MKRYDVKLAPWTDPVIVEATTKSKAAELAVNRYPVCDCCGEATKVQSVMLRKKPIRFYQSVIMEVRK